MRRGFARVGTEGLPKKQQHIISMAAELAYRSAKKAYGWFCCRAHMVLGKTAFGSAIANYRLDRRNRVILNPRLIVG